MPLANVRVVAAAMLGPTWGGLAAVAWLTAGEGLHNNHHAAPTSARLSLARREIDPGWWLIRALSSARLATVRHADTKLRSTAGETEAIPDAP